MKPGAHVWGVWQRLLLRWNGVAMGHSVRAGAARGKKCFGMFLRCLC